LVVDATVPNNFKIVKKTCVLGDISVFTRIVPEEVFTSDRNALIVLVANEVCWVVGTLPAYA